MDNSSAALSYIIKKLDTLDNRLVYVERVNKAIYKGSVAKSQKPKENNSSFEYTVYGPLLKMSENRNIWPDLVSGEPRWTEITSIYKASRIVGEEDLVSLTTDIPFVQYFMGSLGGNSIADVYDFYKPLRDDENLINSFTKVNYGIDLSEDGNSAEVSYNVKSELDELKKKLEKTNNTIGKVVYEMKLIEGEFSLNNAEKIYHGIKEQGAETDTDDMAYQ